ncbi:MAG: alpha/beta hydrolase [Acidimicrobiales bacterium]|jgi:acetyl esterase|nr:alpha/beta hydrolase [Acidimicrobiales bacterium]
MSVDPNLQPLLDVINASDVRTHDLSPEQARAAFAALAALGGEGAEVAGIEERELAGVPCLVVTPHGERPLPVLVWLHGGGFVIGSAAESLHTARDLAARAGCLVVSVDYRLAPEHPAPAAADDCVAVARWVLEHAAELGGDPTRVAIGGDSAGGNLSAVVALEVPGFVHQLLVYPVTDLTMSHPSMIENGEGYLLERATIAWFHDHYLSGGVQPTDPRVSPLFTEDERLSGLPPAHVITAEYDPLRDEGEAYAEKLRAAGVRVVLDRYEGQIHAFFSLTQVTPAAVEAQEQAAAHLKLAFGTA